MAKNDRNRKKRDWTKAIEDAFRLMGYDGNVIISDDPTDSRRWIIEHTCFGCCFDGYPSTDDTYAITLSNHPFTDPNGIVKTHLEWLVFDSTSMVPLYYAIHESPDYQRIQINSTSTYLRGDILYQNLSHKTTDKVRRLTEPCMSSEMIDIGSLLNNLKNLFYIG